MHKDKKNLKPIILDSAFQADKVAQDFELESLSIGVEHSQKVKASPIKSDYCSKDYVNLSCSTAESRIMRSFCLLSTILVSLILHSCSNSSEKIQKTSSYLCVAVLDDPTSLDPRLVRDLPSSTIMRMLFEGLMSVQNGKIVPGIAERVTLSDDQKTYTFHLRPSVWSDGLQLTAQDFEETWKSILSPSFPAQNAYQLYMIKGAKAAKEGKISPEAIGVKATTTETLVVELEQPTPYFLEIASCHFSFPVHPSLRNQTNKRPGEMIGNGPFRLDNWIKRSEFNVSKNPYYWDAEHITLHGISLHILDEHTALQLFKTGQLDWAGSPLSTLPQDAITTLKQKNKLLIAQGAGTHWFRLNTKALPFNNENMRRAFSLAINRQAIIDHVTQGNQQPAMGIIPPSLGWTSQNFYSDHDIANAQALFREALEKLGMGKNELPKITLSYASNDRNRKIAQVVQQQWKQALGIDIDLEGNEIQMQLDKVKKGNYELAMGSWYADIQDPINFLEIFKHNDNPANQTYWHNSEYAAYLDQSSLELDPTKRLNILADSERILIQEMPIIPLFYSAYNYLKSDRIENVYFSPLGYLDFKSARLKEKVAP